ncbi:MAG: four helix bundle protein [Prevotella sp.]|nr:four helix bundle protein [Prevotella sp.]
MGDNVANNIYLLARAFAIRITKLNQYLKEEKKEYIISNQIFRSGTSIGANAFEGKEAQSRADFNSKMNIALKETSETGFWLDLLHAANYLDDAMFVSINDDCEHLKAVLTKIVKSTKK